MHHDNQYIFTSERLGFRNWTVADLGKMAEINANEKVMEFFPATQSIQQTRDFIQRMQELYAAKGFCYFAVDQLEDQAFIGFIGLCEQTYPAPFTPCVDIGWRLHPDVWNQGFAVEGAKRCLDFACTNLKLANVYAIAPKLNTRSERVMQKIGMIKQYEFNHPLLENDSRLQSCVLYKAETTNRVPD